MIEQSKLSGVQRVAMELYELHGQIATKDLVDAARPKNSPAHDAFEWDNSKAGEEYRLIQARHYIRRIRITRETEPERLVHVPRVMRDDDDSSDGHYQVPSVLVARPNEFDRALTAARQRVESANCALSDLYRAAESGGRTEQAVLIAQMSRAASMFVSALQSMH